MVQQILTIDRVAKRPDLITFLISLPNGSNAQLRPLIFEDEEGLVLFFRQLSESTRRFYSFSGSEEKHAQELCRAINQYDKLRLVVEKPISEKGIIGLVEFSFAILEADIKRYLKYKLTLNPDKDCRYGLCISDQYQNQRIGSLLFPYVKKIALLFGKSRIILWGGVHSDNALAIRHYKRNGFEEVGEYTNSDGNQCIDMFYSLNDEQLDLTYNNLARSKK